MTKVTLAMTVSVILVMAGCSSSNNDSAPVVRNGPQTQNPVANSPGGKLPNGTGAATRVIIDDSAPIVTVASSPALAQTSTSIFEFIR